MTGHSCSLRVNEISFDYFLPSCAPCSVVLAMFWFAIQTFTGSECTYQVCNGALNGYYVRERVCLSVTSPQMVKAIWPSFAHWPNHLPASANISSAGG